jgi:hypothetical protein
MMVAKQEVGRIGSADRATRPAAQAPAGLGDTASVPSATPSIYERLSAEFPRDAIHWRALTMAGSGNKALAVGYMDARDVMDRLDQVCTPSGWRNRVEETDKGRILCTVEILIDGQWIGKCDGAGDTAVEGAKGAISDAFKRSAVLWGVGRYLYRLPAVWAPCESTEKNGKRYFKNWLRSPWNRIPDDWVANTYSDDPTHDPETGVVIESKGVKGISGIKERMRELRAAGDQARDIETFNTLVRANKDDLQVLKDDNHDWWAGDGIDEEGLKSWIRRRRAELEPVELSDDAAMCLETMETCTSANDLAGWFKLNWKYVERLDGAERDQVEARYEELEAHFKAVDHVGA